MSPRLMGFLASLAAAAGLAAAQRALDANPMVGGDGRNRPAPKMQMAKPIYTVNRNTGEMVYNRANAFNDPTYNIYQRYTIDRLGYFDPTRPAKARRIDTQAMLSPTPRTSSRWSPSAYGPPSPPRSAVGGSGRSHGASRASSGHMAGSPLRAPSYRVSAPRPK